MGSRKQSATADLGVQFVRQACAETSNIIRRQGKLVLAPPIQHVGIEAVDDDKDRSAWLIWGTTAATLCWAAFCGYFLTRKDFWGLNANEFGDLFAGAVAPVAFFWLAVTVFLQRNELRLQRKELRAQREEHKANRELQVPLRQRQDIEDHLDDLIRLIFSLRDHLKNQMGSPKTSQRNFAIAFAALNDHDPRNSDRLEILEHFLKMVEKMTLHAAAVADQHHTDEWFKKVVRELRAVHDSAKGLIKRLEASESARDFTRSYDFPVSDCQTKTSELIAKLEPNWHAEC